MTAAPYPPPSPSGVRLAFYRGLSAASRAIRWQTWSPYSHVAVAFPDGRVVEAWKTGVRFVDGLSVGHVPGTRVDLFALDPVLTLDQHDRLYAFLSAQAGKPYDWRGVFRFLPRCRIPIRERDAWFCSELVFAAFIVAGYPLLHNVHAWQVSPGILAYSPFLVSVGSAITARERNPR